MSRGKARLPTWQAGIRGLKKSMPKHLKILSPEEELRFMREELQMHEPAAILDRVIGNYGVLQARSAMLLSLISLCLTVSGFSGHRIAAAGLIPALCLAVGLLLALSSAVMLMLGPLQLRWATRRRCDGGMEQTLLSLIRLRDQRTKRFHHAVLCLVLGLSFYVAAVVQFVLLEGIST